MNNDIKIYEHDKFGEIRVIDKDGDPWFVAKDVCEALGYKWKGISTVNHILSEWRGVYSVQTPSGTQDMLCISEQGLYFFLGRSDKKTALPFQKWLAGDVLPSIRKHGAYMTGDLMAHIKANPRAIGELLINLANEEDKRQELEAREEIWGTGTPYGEISKRTGKPRTQIVRGYPRSRRDDPIYTITTITETQMRLFNPYGYEDN